MYKIFGFLAITFAVVQCNPLPSDTTRHGNFNQYYIYTRNNSRVPIQLFPNLLSISEASTSFRPMMAIIVHGHEGSASTSLNPVVKDTFLMSEDVSVIVVDWSTYAGQRYSNAVNAVPSVGVALAEFIELLVFHGFVSLERLHLVGFNLGAHVIGFTGRRLGGQVARITGLDPTSSQWGSNSQRLAASDARYVEVIHTDGSGIFAIGLGTAIGDVDFFANGGSNQPGCLTHECSHNRAWQFFAASLTHDHLIGNMCSTDLQLSTNRCRGLTLPMGNNDLLKIGSGRFRINTGRTYPY